MQFPLKESKIGQFICFYYDCHLTSGQCLYATLQVAMLINFSALPGDFIQLAPFIIFDSAIF